MNLENYTNINIFKKVYENREVMSSNNMIEQPHHVRKAITEAGNAEHSSGFNPYVNNQGTTVGKLLIDVNQVSFFQPLPAKIFAWLPQILVSLRALTSWQEIIQRLLALLTTVLLPQEEWLLILRLFTSC